jgi:hypothetical protein
MPGAATSDMRHQPACGHGSEDEFVTERKEPVPKWEVLAENRDVWEQLCKQLRLEVGGLG